MHYNATAIVRRRNDGAGFQSGQKAESKIRLNVKINGESPHIEWGDCPSFFIL